MSISTIAILAALAVFVFVVVYIVSHSKKDGGISEEEAQGIVIAMAMREHLDN